MSFGDVCSSPNVTKQKAVRSPQILRRLLSRSDRRTEDTGVPDAAGSILGCLLFGRDQRTRATNVFRRSAIVFSSREVTGMSVEGVLLTKA